MNPFGSGSDRRDDDGAWSALFAGLERLKNDWPAQGVWSEDRGLGCLLCAIPTSALARADAALAQLMPAVFGAAELAAAPPAARDLAEESGGLRAAQRLRWSASSGSDAPACFALLWPWADGGTVSIRVGLRDPDQSPERAARMRQIFLG